MSIPKFQQITLSGADISTFLQGQLTADVRKLAIGGTYQPTAIANLKGRIDFGLWIQKTADQVFDVVISRDCVDSLLAHIKKYGAFSKITVSAPIDVYPCLSFSDTQEPTFSKTKEREAVWDWMARSIEIGNYWITAATQGLFQPQELRLHQRGGVDYDKGCYIGQEVIARIYFKAAPKAFLHRIEGKGQTPNAGDILLEDKKIKVVNAIALDGQFSGNAGYEALVVAPSQQLADHSNALTLLPLPTPLQGSVARES